MTLGISPTTSRLVTPTWTRSRSKGLGGASVVEILADHDGDIFRAVYTVRFRGVVYTLHAFQKKAKKGIKTPQKELELIKQRLRDAEQHYKEHYGSNKSE